MTCDDEIVMQMGGPHDVPDGRYSCDLHIDDLGGQHVEATAVVTGGGRCLLLAGASVAVPCDEGTFLRIGGGVRREGHVDFSVSAVTRDDVELPDLLEATKFVLGRNTGWRRAMSLWANEGGVPLGELVAEVDAGGCAGVSYETFPSVPDALVPGLERLLLEVDNDFLPPLSSRSSATQRSFGCGYYPSMNVRPYLESLLGQRLVTASDGSGLVGFLSWAPSDDGGAYVSTIATSRRLRGSGVGRGLYEAFEAACDARVATLRTWSTNWTHLRLLRELGYEEVSRIANHRGAGVDTVCLSKRLRG